MIFLDQKTNERLKRMLFNSIKQNKMKIFKECPLFQAMNITKTMTEICFCQFTKTMIEIDLCAILQKTILEIYLSAGLQKAMTEMYFLLVHKKR